MGSEEYGVFLSLSHQAFVFQHLGSAFLLGSFILSQAFDIRWPEVYYHVRLASH